MFDGRVCVCVCGLVLVLEKKRPDGKFKTQVLITMKPGQLTVPFGQLSGFPFGRVDVFG